MSTTWLWRLLAGSTMLVWALVLSPEHNLWHFSALITCNAINLFVGGVLIERHTCRRRLERMFRGKD